MVKKRKATHAGSWYPAQPQTLSKDIKTYLDNVRLPLENPVKVKAVICPHAGYSYCGETAAYCWKALSSSLATIKRVVILAPSHYCSFQGIALPFKGCQFYSTPFGDFPLDIEVLETLREELKCIRLSASEDEEEHSIEMMLPFLHSLYTIFSQDEKVQIPQLIPLLVGSSTTASSGLLNLFHDPACVFVISSDFCHWGSRFHYFYVPAWLKKDGSNSHVNEQIQVLDDQAIDAICRHDTRAFKDHLKTTHNTICGANPILLLLQLIDQCNLSLRTLTLHYSQSSEIKNIKSDTCVSYAALLTLME